MLDSESSSQTRTHTSCWAFRPISESPTPEGVCRTLGPVITIENEVCEEHRGPVWRKEGKRCSVPKAAGKRENHIVGGARGGLVLITSKMLCYQGCHPLPFKGKDKSLF